MKRSSLAVRVVLLIVSIVASAALLQAQYRTSIQGVVTDPTGAVVPGATLTLTNPATGEKQVRVSNDAGVFNFNALAAAGALSGWKWKRRASRRKSSTIVELIPEQPNALNVELAIGSESQTVNVTLR